MVVMFTMGTLILCVSACGSQQKKLKADLDKAAYHYNLGVGHYFDGNSNVDAALQEVLKALRSRPEYPEAHFLAGLIFMGREMNLEAIRHFKRVLELQPKYYRASNNLGSVYLKLGRWDDAIAIFKELAGNMYYATPGVAHNNLGWALFKKARFVDARRHLIMANQYAPKLCPPYNNLALVLLELDKVDKAKKWLRRGVKKCPSYAEPNYHLGRLASKVGQFDGARKHFERCVELARESSWGERCQERLGRLPAPAVSR